MSAVAVSLKEVRFYMRNVRTRMPFKYGVAVLTSVPILHVVARCELIDGTVVEVDHLLDRFLVVESFVEEDSST